MTTLITPIAPVVVADPRESLWDQFLRDLTWWQRQTLFRRELDLHDDFIDGFKTLMDIFAEVAEKADEPLMGYSTKT